MTPRPPNLLLFVSDQQRTDTMAAYGNDWIDSPHLNALAAGSYVFDHAYCTQPVCTAARASLLTGLHPQQHGCVVNNIGLRSDTPTLAEMLPDGWHRAHLGKWHLGDDAVCQHGFDEWVSVEDHRRPRYATANAPYSDLWHWLRSRGREPAHRLANGDRVFDDDQRAGLPADEQMAAFLAGRAETFLEARAARPDTPWLLVVSTFEPHPPYTGPHDGLYDPASLPVGPAFRHDLPGHADFGRSRAAFFPTATVDGQDLSTDRGWRTLRARYLGNVKTVDDAVGRILRALDETGQADRTAVAFTSDHGEMAGDLGIWEKRVLYDPSARVPLLLRVPWLSQDTKRVRGVCSHVDLAPTLLELAGVPAAVDGLPGRSLLPALTGAADLRRHQAFLQWNGQGVAQPGGYRHDDADAIVRDRDLGAPAVNAASAHPRRGIVSGDRWKLTLCADDRGELFDLVHDPYELANRYADPDCAERVRDLTSRIRRWQADTGDTAPLS